MSTGKLPFHIAYRAASLMIINLRHCTERLEIAGSLRRHISEHGTPAQVPEGVEVGDIELVAIPKLEEQLIEGQQTSLLVASQTRTINLLWERLDSLSCGDDTPFGPYIKQDRNGKPDKKWGPRYRRCGAPDEPTMQLLPCDIFTTTQEYWGAQFAIRTGPWEFSQALVSLRKDEGILFRDGEVLVRGVPTPVPEEWDLFALLGVPVLEPHKRTRERIRRQAA